MSRIAVLRHVPHETAGTVQSFLNEAGLDWHYVNLFGEAPERLDPGDAAGLVVLGGPMNVDQVDAYPWLLPELAWIREALDAELPILGVCLGAQLLAKALGANVAPNHVKEIGWHRIELTEEAEDDRLFAGCGTSQTVFQLHGDTFALPEGAVHLARSRQCENQAFRYGRSAYGLQFHIEMTPELIEAWLDEPSNRREFAALDYVDPDTIRAETPRSLPRMATLANRVLPRFAAMCQESQASE